MLVYQRVDWRVAGLNRPAQKRLVGNDQHLGGLHGRFGFTIKIVQIQKV